MSTNDKPIVGQFGIYFTGENSPHVVIPSPEGAAVCYHLNDGSITELDRRSVADLSYECVCDLADLLKPLATTVMNQRKRRHES